MRREITMTTVIPEGEAIKKAIRWVSNVLEEDPNADVLSLVNKAIAKFDLSPKDAEFLLGFYRNRECASHS